MTDIESRATSMRTLILGCGNDLRGDDALGPLVAAQLEELLCDHTDVDIDTCSGLTPDLAATLIEYDRVVFIDCAASGPVGAVQRAVVTPHDNADLACVHLLDFPALLTWTQHLYGRTPYAVALTVPGERFELSEDLSPRVAAAVPALIAAVDRELQVVPEGVHRA